MTTKNKEILYVPIETVHADSTNPRKNFDIAKINQLAKTIKENGILEPLQVEAIGKNKYILVAGERRLRAAKSIKLKEVPIIIMENLSESDRQVKRFQLEESKEMWNTTERGKAVHDLHKTLKDRNGNKLTIQALSDLIGIDTKTITTSLAFGKILNKESLLRAEIGLEMMPKLVTLNNQVKKIYQEQFNEEFEEHQQRAFEAKIITLCQEGKISNARELNKIKDAIVSKPNVIKEILKTSTSKLTPDGMFIKSHAQSAYYLRNLIAACHNAKSNGGKWLKIPSMPTKRDITIIRTAAAELNAVIKLYETKYAE